ncbi:MAG: GNAT family N-acetyltransferase [Candidatus Omnitrophica bacterium]|nr:GNAT family N-acetyltransferase [Candidatus Omnitrophota bacterium]
MSQMLRRFNKEDAKGVKDLILSILTQEYPFDKSAYSDSDLERIDEVYGGENESFFVVEEDGEIVGTVGVKGETENDALLRRLFVDLKHRRHGHGTKLLKTAIDFCRSSGYRRIFFRCTDRMADAMRLCVKNGFKEAEALNVSGFKIHKLMLEF